MMGIEDENEALRQRVAELERRVFVAEQHAEQSDDIVRKVCRERDSANRAAEIQQGRAADAEKRALDSHMRVERAEADNAALRASLQKFRDSIFFGERWGAWFCSTNPPPASNPNAVDEHALREALTVLDRNHPGASLLEYVRALEAVLPLASHDEACQLDVSGTPDPTNCALCAADALKERKP